MILPKTVKDILWDIDLKSIDWQRYKRFLIARVAEKGSWQDILWLKRNFSSKVIKRNILDNKNVSAKTKNFWRMF